MLRFRQYLNNRDEWLEEWNKLATEQGLGEEVEPIEITQKTLIPDIKNYADLKRYIKFLCINKNIKSPLNIEHSDIEKFIKSLYIQKTNSKKVKQHKPASLKRCISSLRGYHQYLYQSGEASENHSQLIMPPRIIRKIPVTLMVEEINNIIQELETLQKTDIELQGISYKKLYKESMEILKNPALMKLSSMNNYFIFQKK